MKILIINTFDQGGAANSCKRLHLELIKYGIDSKVLLKNKRENWPASFAFQHSKPLSLLQRVKRKINHLIKKAGFDYGDKKEIAQNLFINSRDSRLEMFSFPFSKFDITESLLYKEADIINLHWVANFLDYVTFFRKNKKPIVWTLHDMNPFTGGEHYDENFLGIDEGGLPSKRQKSVEEIELTRGILQIKEKIFHAIDNLTIVTPSKWLKEKARKSSVFKGKEIYCIPYGLDPKIYYPKDRKVSKNLLNIPQEKKVILFVADSISKNRKGFAYLEKAFERLESQNLILCAVGTPNSEDKSKNNYLELGSINNEELMSSAYSAADVFVIPSLMDNLPNTVLESLMCGTPVIGFPVGGIPEMVQNNFNGIIAEEISVNALAAAITKFLDNPEIFERKAIRKAAVQHYDQSIQVNKYISLFKEILNINS